MKRFLSVFAAFILVVMTAAFPASASSQPKFYLEGPSAAEVGDTIEVSLKLEGTYEASVIKVGVVFDPAAFTYVSYSNGDATAAFKDLGAVIMCELSDQGRAVSYGAVMISDPATESGTLIKIRFTVRSADVPNQKLTVDVGQFAYLPIGSTQATDIAFTKSDLSITLSGSAAANTPAPAVTETPEPAVTETPDPNVTDTPDPNVTDTPAPEVTATPNEPRRTEEVPISYETPAPTDNGGEKPNEPAKDPKIKNIIAFSIAGAAVLAAVIVLIVKSRKSSDE